MILTVEDFLASTYDFGELFWPLEEWLPKNRLRVREVYTRIFGRCFLVQPDQDISSEHFVTILPRNVSSLMFYIISRGQVSCNLQLSH